MNSKYMSRLGWGALQILILALSLLIIIPLLVMLIGSFKNEAEVTAFNLSLPSVWKFDNFSTVISEGKLIRSFFNGIFIAGVSVIFTSILSSMAAFIIIRRSSGFSRFLYYFFFLGLIAPMQMIPTIKLMQSLKIYGGYISVIVIYIATNMAFSIFLYSGFISTIPKALDEAAAIEGASTLKLFFKVIFPLIKPVSVTVAIIIFMNVWNDINLPIYFLNDSNKWTMPLSVYKFYGKYGGSWNLVFADLTLTAVPVFIIYLLGQKHIVSGMTAGAIKA